jgi:hypothetical protein
MSAASPYTASPRLMCHRTLRAATSVVCTRNSSRYNENTAPCSWITQLDTAAGFGPSGK